MEAAPGIPPQVCHHCASHVTTFLPFLKLCRDSAARWTYISERLLNISSRTRTKANTAFIFVTDRVRTVLEQRGKAKNRDAKYVKTRINRLRIESNEEQQPVTKTVEEIGQSQAKLYSCEECGAEYRKLSEINHHLANQNKRLCGQCHTVVNLKTFANHLQQHQIPFFKCMVCSLPFGCKEQLDKHKNVHLGRNMCSECKRTFPTADILTLHVHRKHEADICNNCSKKFSNRICLFKHRSNCRAKALKKFVCDYCSKEFSDRSVIKSHITLVHAKKLLHQCEHCGKQFNSACHLEEHFETHDVIRDRFVCAYCDNKYRTSGGFRRHMRQKHYSLSRELKNNVKYSCDICARNFISEKNLNNHLKAKKHKNKGLKNKFAN